jgi:hypothetical protein
MFKDEIKLTTFLYPTNLTTLTVAVDSPISQISIPPLYKPRAARFSEIHWTLTITPVVSRLNVHK